ncbi:MAG TPA: hypothetical protein PKU97_24090, partial [Kofleriaceae bacterium]|nr:hypothetical protein [Kofleriaceae bacterium]
MTTVLLVNVLAALALAGCLAESVAQDESEGGPAALASSLSNRARLPIVLLHGMAGFDQIGPLDY